VKATETLTETDRGTAGVDIGTLVTRTASSTQRHTRHCDKQTDRCITVRRQTLGLEYLTLSLVSQNQRLSYRQSLVLRSSTSDLLSTQSSSTNIAARRFSCCAPTVWNSLPSSVRTADSFVSFRSQLTTYVHRISRIIDHTSPPQDTPVLAGHQLTVSGGPCSPLLRPSENYFID